jgi:hypothetical protein
MFWGPALPFGADYNGCRIILLQYTSFASPMKITRTLIFILGTTSYIENTRNK